MKEVSKYLSYILRHAPDGIGLQPDRQGWVSVEALLLKSAAAGRTIDRDMLLTVVAGNDKKRFTLSDDGQRIRAAQGHSIPVDLGLPPSEPPAVLFHGRASRHIANIRAQGLKAGGRQKVHLSLDEAMARRVGRRHGQPVVLRVDAAGMHAAGFEFWRADNGVWLTHAVPPRFLDL